jgi:hypothetical protein
MTKLISWLALALAFTAGAFGQNVVLTSWNMTGYDGRQESVPATYNAQHIAGFDFTRGPGLSPTAVTISNSFAAVGFQDHSPQTNYISFGFDIEPGYAVNLDTLRIGTRSSSDGPFFVDVVVISNVYTGSTGFIMQGQNQFVNSVRTFGHLGGPFIGRVEVRISQTGTVSPDGGNITETGNFRITNWFGSDNGNPPAPIDVRFTGTVVPDTGQIPEPATTALLVGGIILGMVISRRRHQSRASL